MPGRHFLMSSQLHGNHSPDECTFQRHQPLEAWEHIQMNNKDVVTKASQIFISDTKFSYSNYAEGKI